MSDITRPLLRSEVNNVLQKLEAHLSPSMRTTARQLLSLLDERGSATSDALHTVMFPLATTKSASAQLSKLLGALKDAAEKAGLTLGYQYEGEKQKGAGNRQLRFLGPAIALVADLEGLRSIPSGQIIAGQTAHVLLDTPTLLIVTFNEHEHIAVTRSFAGSTPPATLNKGDCLVDDLGQHGGMRVLHRFSQQGSLNAQESVTLAANAYSPRYTIACGIAFGVDPSKQHIGDVLVSQVLVPYELSRATRGTLELRDGQPPASALLTDWLRNLDQRKKIGPTKGTWPNVIWGGILTGDKLIDDQNYRDQLVELAGKNRIVGGEMEGAGVHVALRRQQGHWIVIKGICDWADGNKNTPHKTNDQKLAAANAAEVVKALVETGWLLPPPHERSQAQGDAKCDEPNTEPCDELENPSHDLDVLKKQGHFAEHQRGSKTELRQAGLGPRPKDALANEQTQANQTVIALEYLHDWAIDPKERPFFALLGETGMGKTTHMQRLVDRLNRERAAGQAVSIAVYFDLRKVNVAALSSTPNAGDRDTPPLSISESTMLECIRHGWLTVGGRLPSLQEVLNAVDKGALVIFDGLDEVLSRIGESEGLTFTQGLLRTLEESRVRIGLENSKTIAPKLLVTCRTQFFRSLSEQDEHLTGERRSPNTPERFRALELLPLNDEQIRQYLSAALPQTDVDVLMCHIAAIHNLRELAGRPFTLTLIEQFLPRIQDWLNAGQRVTGAVLYREVARDWLVRDKQKQSLRLEDKEDLASDMALWFARDKLRGASACDLEDWFDRWLHAKGPHSRYVNMPRDVLYEDLRNSTFLKRIDQADAPTQSRLEFAHTSLFEFFLARGLMEAVRNHQRTHWQMGQVSNETLNFLGQLLEADPDRANLLNELSNWRLSALPMASQLQLAYAEFAFSHQLPQPKTAGFDLRGLDLSDWTVGHQVEPLGQLCNPLFDLQNARFDGCTLGRTQFWACALRGANWDGVQVAQLELIACDIDSADFQNSSSTHIAQRWPAQLPSNLQGAIPTVVSASHIGTAISFAFSPDGQTLASTGSDGTLRLWNAATGAALLVTKGAEGSANACAFSPDGQTLASTGDDGTLRLWNAATGAALLVIKGHEGSVHAFAFSPNGKTLASAGDDGTLRLWNASTGAPLRSHLHANCASAAWLPEGHLLHASGRAWRYLNYQYLDETGANRIASIEDCSPWGAG
ncbi:MAG: hypothetical protein CFE43_08915 [Burkholderiales bacterium PBB3]|nr:MAG: hypothetical protein CFE43_08915 [Burkholderiales bacterium PBB3]